MLSQMARFHSFLWLNNIPVCVCVYHIFFIYSSVNGHNSFGQVLTIVNNAAMSMGVQYLFNILFSFPLHAYPEMRLLDHMVVLFLVF